MDVQTSTTGRDFWVTDPTPDQSEHHLSAFSDNSDTPSFKDVIDTINPLQHIPVISTVYRKLTGDDDPGAVPRVLGGLLYGGPVGFILEAVNSAIDDSTGKDVGGHVWAALFDDDSDTNPSATKFADSNPPSDTPAATPPTAEAVATASPPSPVTDQTLIAQSAPVQAAPQPQVVRQPIQAPPTQPKDQQADMAVTATPQPLAPKLLASASATPPTSATGTANSSLPAGFMPVPIRRAIQVSQPMPANAIVTTSNQRSNLPNAGRVLANPSQTDTRGIALTQAGDKPIAVQPVASPPVPAQTSAPNAWLPDAMAKALDKYEQMNKLKQKAQADMVAN